MLCPMFVGFLFPVRSPLLRRLAALGMSACVYAILLAIGFGLSLTPGLSGKIGKIMGYGLTFAALLLSLNVAAVAAFDRFFPWAAPESKPAQGGASGKLLGSGAQLSFVAVGYVAGRMTPHGAAGPDAVQDAILGALMLMLFLVGVHTRSSGMSLRKVFFNSRAMQILGVFLFSCALAAFLAAPLLGIPLTQSLALCSGFGWYSLSSSVMASAYNPFWGSVALVNDFAREIAALALIPVLTPKAPGAAVAVGGATSLDFALPVIVKAGGVGAMALAMSFSFPVNLLSPVLMAVFANL